MQWNTRFEYIYIFGILFLYSNIRRKIYFVSSFLFIYFEKSILSDPAIRYNEILKIRPYEEIFGSIYCDICETKVHIYTAIFLLPHFSQIELFFDLKSFENDIQRIKTVHLSRRKLLPWINRKRFIRDIRRFRRNSWFLRRFSKTLSLFPSVICSAGRSKIFKHFFWFSFPSNYYSNKNLNHSNSKETFVFLTVCFIHF